MKSLKILAVIPARGGSKGIQKKNLARLINIPLVGYSIKAAISSKMFEDIVVSTDDSEIMKVSAEMGAQTPFIRPGYLASDSALTAPVVEHALLEMESQKKFKYDAIMLLQPTSPLRTDQHIRSAIEIFMNNECDSVVSVTSVGGNHPLRMKKILPDGRLENYIDQGFWNLRPRQELPPIFIRNGAIYLIKRESFLREKSLIANNCFAYEMLANDSVNIDTELDLVLAEQLIIRRKNNEN